jgi:hypothetical protein
MSCFSREPENTSRKGERLPSFKILLMDSTSVLDTKDIAANKSFVFFYFGPHCPYSRAQMKEILGNIEKLKSYNFYVISGWPYSELKDFYNHYQLYKYSNITVGYDYTHVFTEYLNIKGVPYLAVYNDDKILKESFAGKTNSKQLISVFEN